MLRLERKEWYQVKAGQTVWEIAKAYGVSARRIIKDNGLKEEPRAGRLLRIPNEQGNVYTAQTGESKALLCGSEENFVLKNGTAILYPGMSVIL